MPPRTSRHREKRAANRHMAEGGPCRHRSHAWRYTGDCLLLGPDAGSPTRVSIKTMLLPRLPTTLCRQLNRSVSARIRTSQLSPWPWLQSVRCNSSGELLSCDALFGTVHPIPSRPPFAALVGGVLSPALFSHILLVFYSPPLRLLHFHWQADNVLLSASHSKTII